MEDDGTSAELSLKLFTVLCRATRSVVDHAHRHVIASNLSPTDFAVLEILLHKGSLPISSIAAKVLLTNGSMTVAVDRLEEKGFVARCAHETDRRTRLVNLTEKGRAVIVPIFAEHAAIIEAATAGLNNDEKLELIRLSKKLGKFAATAESD